MATTADFRNGMVMRFSGELVQIDSFQHVKPGKGGAFVRTRLRRLSDGGVIENTFRAGHDIDVVRLDTREMQYLYRADDLFYFMDMQTYDEMPFGAAQLGDRARFMKESMTVVVQIDEEGHPVTIELPTTCELEVAQTDPGVKGDTVSGGSKLATLETGVVVQVPLFVEQGTVVKIDTRTGEYLGRA